MKRFVMAITLSFVLSVSAFAGDIPTVGLTVPPPDETTEPNTPGDIPSVGFTQQMSEVGLTLVQLALGAVV
jgi:hypothetical protein